MKMVFGVESPSADWCLVITVLLLSLLQISFSFNDAFIPPKFPNILSSFAESLSASDDLRLLVLSLAKDNELCGCSEAGKVNWTEFNANLGLYAFSDINQRCISEQNRNTREPNVGAVSGGHVDHNQPLVIGLSVTVIIFIVIVIFFLTLKKDQYVLAACDVVKRNSMNSQRKRSSCDPTLPSSKSHETVTSTNDDVSKIGYVSFSGKLRMILLPMRNQKTAENCLKSQDDVLGHCPNLGEIINIGQCNEKHSQISNNGHVLSILKVSDKPPLSVNQVTRLSLDHRDENTDDYNFLSDSSDNKFLSDVDAKQKVNRPITGGSFSAGNAAWSVLPNGRQFFNDKEDLVDCDNVNLFSYSTH